MKYLKGQDVSVSLNGDKIAVSTSCTISYTMNTEDVSSKDDEDFFFESNSPTTMQWSVSNESYIADVSMISTLLNLIMSREKVLVTAKDANGRVNLNGYAYITDMSVEATNGEYATISLSLDGTGTDLID